MVIRRNPSKKKKGTGPRVHGRGTSLHDNPWTLLSDICRTCHKIKSCFTLHYHRLPYYGMPSNFAVKVFDVEVLNCCACFLIFPNPLIAVHHDLPSQLHSQHNMYTTPLLFLVYDTAAACLGHIHVECAMKNKQEEEEEGTPSSWRRYLPLRYDDDEKENFFLFFFLQKSNKKGQYGSIRRRNVIFSWAVENWKLIFEHISARMEKKGEDRKKMRICWQRGIGYVYYPPVYWKGNILFMVPLCCCCCCCSRIPTRGLGYKLRERSRWWKESERALALPNLMTPPERENICACVCIRKLWKIIIFWLWLGLYWTTRIYRFLSTTAGHREPLRIAKEREKERGFSDDGLLLLFFLYVF